MIVSKKRRVLFVHVQKTGGSTVDILLLDRLPGARPVRGLADDRHATWQAAIDRTPPLADFFTFGFVRNPWARLDSWYRMIQRRKEHAELNPEGRPARVLQRNDLWRTVIEHYPTFESFVLHAHEQVPRLGRPQLHYLETGGPTGRRADFIGRTEALDEDLRTVLRQLDIEPPDQVPRANSSQGDVDYHDRFTPAMRDAVAHRFAVDIETFGYRF